MKLCLTILIISFLFIEAHVTRVERGLSADEQKKLLDVLNQDRQEVGKKTGLNMKIVLYDTALETNAFLLPCKRNKNSGAGVALQFDDVTQEIYEIAVKKEGPAVMFPLFWPDVTKIGCTKMRRCSISLNEKEVSLFGEKFRGKSSAFQGFCLTNLDTRHELDKDTLLALNNAELPHPSKYGDLLGVPKLNGASLNSFFFLIPLFLVFYI